LPRPILFYDNIRDGTSQDRGVERRIAPNKVKREGVWEERGEKGRNEPPGDQTWIRNEQVILAFFISKSAAASKEVRLDGF